MRFSIIVSLLAFACPLLMATGSRAAAAPYDDALSAAERSLEMAVIKERLYRQVEYPRQRRHLDAQIKLVTAEVDSFRRRVREYERFDKFQTGKALLVTLEESRLLLLDAELRLKNLKEERSTLMRFHGDRCRLLELEALEAKAHLARLRGDKLEIGRPGP